MPRTVRIALLCLVALVATAPVAEAKVPKAPSGLALYKPPKSLAKYTHGDLIWARKVDNPLPQAGLTWTLTYRVEPSPRPTWIPPGCADCGRAGSQLVR